MRYGWAQVGDRLEERFTLINQFVLPATWISLVDHSTLIDHRASVATGVDGYSLSQWKILSRCTRRGVYTLGGATLETGDPFGVYTVTLEDQPSRWLSLRLSATKVSNPFERWTGEGKPGRSLETVSTHARNAPNDPRDPLEEHRPTRQILCAPIRGNACWRSVDLA
jgi:hypothetical protein